MVLRAVVPRDVQPVFAEYGGGVRRIVWSHHGCTYLTCKTARSDCSRTDEDNGGGAGSTVGVVY